MHHRCVFLKDKDEIYINHQKATQFFLILTSLYTRDASLLCKLLQMIEAFMIMPFKESICSHEISFFDFLRKALVFSITIEIMCDNTVFNTV